MFSSPIIFFSGVLHSCVWDSHGPQGMLSLGKMEQIVYFHISEYLKDYYVLMTPVINQVFPYRMDCIQSWF